MLLRLRRPCAATAVVAHRSRWTAPVSKMLLSSTAERASLSSSADAAFADKTNPTKASKKYESKNQKQFALLAPALTTFREYSGHWIVPYHFPIPTTSDPDQIVRKGLGATERVIGLVSHVSEIPWPEQVRGLNLGRVLDKFLKNIDHQAHNPHVVDQLDDIGFPVELSWREYKWKHQTFAALQVYYDLHGHSIVPIQFKVPRDDTQWPVATWGLPLGEIVSNMRQIRDKWTPHELADLESIEFSFDVFESTWSDKILPSLEVFAQVYGHCRVEHSFVVPRKDPWPTEAWGLKLGSRVDNLRSQGCFARQVTRDVQRLEAINFIWNAFEHKWSEIILPSLQMFREFYGHCDVPNAFVVPAQAPWLEDAWGLKLGITVTILRSQGRYAEQVTRDAAELDAIGFVWNAVEHRWSEIILPSLQVFRQLYDHCDVPKAFVVPAQAPWPKVAWGLKLGTTVTTLRSQGCYAEQVTRDAAELDAIGFVWNAFDHKWSEIILPSLKVFRHVFGHCYVPEKFTVPSQVPWPKDAWGLQLGATVSSVRRRGSYAEQVARDAAQLDAIGFVWNPKEERWENVLLHAFECFHELHGHLRIPYKFVVPSKAPWPEAAWRLKLGSALSNIKSNGYYADDRERDHARLAAIGFPVIGNHAK